MSDKHISNEEPFSIYGYLKSNWKNILIYAFLISIVVIIIVWQYSSNKKEKLFSERYAALYEAAETFTAKSTYDFLELFTHSFSLAIISELMRDNFDNVNHYATSLVKRDSRIIEIVVSDENDLIKVSTNKKHEQRSLREYFPFNYVSLKGIKIIEQENKTELIIITPLFVFNQQKGILIIKYEPEFFVYKEL